jgi:hypothetical protein
VKMSPCCLLRDVCHILCASAKVLFMVDGVSNCGKLWQINTHPHIQTPVSGIRYHVTSIRYQASCDQYQVSDVLHSFLSRVSH